MILSVPTAGLTFSGGGGGGGSLTGCNVKQTQQGWMGGVGSASAPQAEGAGLEHWDRQALKASVWIPFACVLCPASAT
jgi:hypothetical protein